MFKISNHINDNITHGRIKKVIIEFKAELTNSNIDFELGSLNEDEDFISLGVDSLFIENSSPYYSLLDEIIREGKNDFDEFRSMIDVFNEEELEEFVIEKKEFQKKERN